MSCGNEVDVSAVSLILSICIALLLIPVHLYINTPFFSAELAEIVWTSPSPILICYY